MIPQYLPEFTLGWGVISWCQKWLNQPDANPNHEQGSRWKFTDEQALFILWFYAVDAEGRWLYERSVLERPKGWGKSPLLAALCCVELLGPVAFAGWTYVAGKRQPAGKPRMDALVCIAAISEDQTKNTFDLLGEMLSGRAQEHYKLQLMLSKVVAPGGREILRVTSSYKTIEGKRLTFCCMDETHLWTPVENGHELAGAVRRGLGKKVGRSIETTNAPVPGQLSVAEESHDTYENMEAGLLDPAPLLLFDTREVHVEDIYDREQVMPALVQVYGDAADATNGWMDLERLWREINDPATREYDARRYYLNERVQEEAKWIKDKQWAKAATEKTLKPQELITLGFTGVTRNGAAALVGCRVADGTLFLLGLWEKPSNLAHNTPWELPVARVDATVRKWMNKDQSKYMVVNPWTLQDVTGRWAVDYPEHVEAIYLAQNSLKYAKMVDQFQESLLADPPRLKHTNDPDLTRHVANAHLHEIAQGFTLRKDKESSKNYIQAAVAAVLAYEAAQIAREKGFLDPPPDTRLFGW